MQVVDTYRIGAFTKSLFTKYLLIVLLLYFTCLTSLSGSSLCMVYISKEGTNTVYYIRGSKSATNNTGVANYLDDCAKYASTNICVHLRIVDRNISFIDVAQIFDICVLKKLSNVIVCWPPKNNEESDELPNFPYHYFKLGNKEQAKKFFPWHDLIEKDQQERVPVKDFKTNIIFNEKKWMNRDPVPINRAPAANPPDSYEQNKSHAYDS